MKKPMKLVCGPSAVAIAIGALCLVLGAGAAVAAGDPVADAVCLDWGYEADHPFSRETAAFRRAKRRFVVCPGTSAWGSLSGRTANMMANVDNAVTNGLANGMSGLMVADWGDGGHPNPWIVSVPAIVYAAHRSG